MINWSPSLRTAVSDLEVEYSEEPGFLYYFKYMLADMPGEFIPVATTRPETILGDTAVAVHPEDERYKKFIGKEVLVPIQNRRIPVIADEYVDRAFGTGALKITPAHDPNDYTIGLNHKLEIINILTKTASMNENAGIYAGLDRSECRKKLWEDMKAVGLVIKEQPYTLNVPRSQRGGEIVEPMISTQWFVKIQPLADRALASVKEGRTRIVPERFTKVYYNWLENIHDWCISRQLWWGHRIPVWYCDDCHEMTVAREDPTECGKCHSKHIHQGRRRVGYLVLLRLVAVFHFGMAGTNPRVEVFLPHLGDGDRRGHPLLLGGAYDDVWSRIYGCGTLPHHLSARVDSRREWQENEQDQGQRGRSPGGHG